jgi:lipopolysaccharide/colanic/teichoic acid biosynthesis glycosyltransferase
VVRDRFHILIALRSISGPRPDLIDQIAIYEGDEIRKLEAVPGITGYNQAYQAANQICEKLLTVPFNRLLSCCSSTHVITYSELTA